MGIGELLVELIQTCLEATLIQTTDSTTVEHSKQSTVIGSTSLDRQEEDSKDGQ